MSQPSSHQGERGPLSIRLESEARGLSMAGSRAILQGHVTIDMLRKQMVHQVGEDLARAVVAQAGRHAGFNEAQVLLQEQSFESAEEMQVMQYRLLTASGFGAFKTLDLAVDRGAKEAYIRVRCVGSPEAESHRRLFGPSQLPACWHLVGYSTGWASAMSGLRLLTIESRCVAKGDDHCEFETLPYQDFVGPEATFWKRAFESSSASLAQELQDKLSTIEKQVATISAQKTAIAVLSAPILQVADDLLVLPIIGAVDSARTQAMAERLLPEVVRRGARGVILDVTGVDSLDTNSASHLLSLARSTRLLGARVALTGISPGVAQVLTSLGIEMRDMVTLRSLQEGIRHFEQRRHKAG